MTSTPYIDYFKEFSALNGSSAQILVEGDSWFAIPKLKNLIKQLDRRGHFNILNFAYRGDEATDTMSWKQKRKIHRVLLDRDNEFDFKILLYSAGGNDIVGPEMWHIFKTYENGMEAVDCFNETMLKIKLKQIEMAHRELIEIRNNLKPSLPIVTHTYDYARPSGQSFKILFSLAGPWIRPSMKSRKIPGRLRQSVVDILMEKVRDMLLSIEADTDNYYVIDTLGTLTEPTQWNDELHPTSAGFAVIFEEKFQPKLEELGLTFD